MNTQSARNVKEFVHVLERDGQGRPTRLLVPGHEGKLYEVDLERNGKLEADCHQVGESGTVFYAHCKGAQHNICYHILAACMVAAEEQGKEVHWRDSETTSRLSARLLEGEQFSVKSAQSGKVAWGVVLGGEPELAEAGLSKGLLINLALNETGDKTQWCVGETVWLANDAFLKNDDGVVRLYRIDRSQKYPQPEMLAVVYHLDLQGGTWRPQAQLTPAQAETELFDDRDSALPIQRERGRSKLFKT